jgi:DNA invertase Pin-like site-specific DNA recombinase
MSDATATSPEKTPPKAVIYSRVSTQEQDNDRQVQELKAYAESKGLEVYEIVQEKLSGATGYQDRQDLSRVLELARQKQFQLLLVHEVSRLGRNTLDVLQVLEELATLRISVYVHQYKLETLDDEGNRNPLAQFIFTMLADISRMERENLIYRIKSGIERARREGKHVGRPPGSTLSEQELLKRHKKVVRLLREGHSIRNTASIAGCSTGTVQKVKQRLGQKT